MIAERRHCVSITWVHSLCVQRHQFRQRLTVEADPENSRELGWTAMNTHSSAVLVYVAVCGILRCSRRVTVHRQCFPSCDDVNIRTLIVYIGVPKLVNSMFTLFFCDLSNINCWKTLHVADDRKTPPNNWTQDIHTGISAAKDVQTGQLHLSLLWIG